MKLYKISGSSEYVDWDILHNQQGYSTSATNPVTWKSSLGNTWGETVADGYMEPTAASGWATKGFCLGKRGWHNMDDMANIYYVWPDIATSTKARHATWGESDVAVWDYDGTHTLYLVQKELEEGWMNEDTFAERGWEIVPDVPLGELVFVDASTGDVVYSVESLNEMVFAPTGYFTIDDSDDVVFVEELPYPARGTLVKNYDPNVTIADGSGVDTELPYYSQKLYIPVVVWHDENWNLGSDYFGWDLSDSSGSIYATNNTGSSRIVISIIVAMIDATDAEIVEVRNQSDAHFYAFKWTSGGVPYWYVVDGDEEWTDDLEADGYEEVPAVVLPTVTTHYWEHNNGWVESINGAESVSAGGSSSSLRYGYAEGDHPVYVIPDYESNRSYGIIQWQQTAGTTAGRIEFEIAELGGKICAKNISSATKTFLQARVAVCSSNQATVVTVYNASNVAYNAFRFTASGTDYYYVLDGVQADWTDDLASIGYRDYTDVTLYAPGGNHYCQPNITSGYTGEPNSSNMCDLYTDSACTIQATYDSTKRYERGVFVNDVWTPAKWQSLADMPDTTVSSGGTATYIIQKDSNNKAKLWFITNLNMSGSYLIFNTNPQPVRFRVYS